MYLIFVVTMLMVSALILIRPTKASSVRMPAANAKMKVRKRSIQGVHSQVESGFRGFIIKPGQECCQASAELQRITFTYRDSLPLPLASCNKTICRCQKREISERRRLDRRSTLDRRKELRFTTGEVDRRVKRGRREHDNIWSGGHIH